MKFLKSNQAFTLIEVLASITLLSIVAIMFLTFFSNATLFSQKTEDTLTSINLANKLLIFELDQLKKDSRDCSSAYSEIKDYGKYKYKVQLICPASHQEQALNLLPVKISILKPEEGNSEITTVQGYLDINPN